MALTAADVQARCAEIPAEFLLTGDFDHLEYGGSLTARELRLATSLIAERFMDFTGGQVICSVAPPVKGPPVSRRRKARSSGGIVPLAK